MEVIFLYIVSEMRGFLLYWLFILILCLTLTFGASLDSKHETAIVAAPDGMIHLVELSSGKILWSFTSGPSIYSSFQALTEGENFYIDCGEDWKLYLHVDNLEKVEVPQSVDEFVRHTPYIVAGGVMLGSKKTTAFFVDSKSGKVIRTYRSDRSKNDLEDWDLDSVDNPLYIMRTDYALMYTTKTGKVLWNLQFADFEASLQCEPIDKFLGGLSHKEGHEVCQTRPLVYRSKSPVAGSGDS